MDLIEFNVPKFNHIVLPSTHNDSSVFEKLTQNQTIDGFLMCWFFTNEVFTTNEQAQIAIRISCYYIGFDCVSVHTGGIHHASDFLIGRQHCIFFFDESVVADPHDP